MSSGKNPLMLMMALAMPGAASAFGLGDIHVDSALNEHLAAEIDIVGGTALELEDLKAAVANRETFVRYGADRPAFLSSTTFKVTHDSQGRPVLALRSTESFTEPVVNLLVELRWRNGSLVRQYTLLLDPAGLASTAPALAASIAPASVVTPAAVVAPAADVAPVADVSAAVDVTAAAPMAATPPETQESPATAGRKTTHIKVGAKATLRGIAWRVGERSESDLQRMMIAIFRANPSAFDGNINRLHRGAVLTIPARTVLAAISKAEAKREIHAQMAAWRAPTTLNPAVTTVPAAVPAAAAATARTALNDRVQSLEQELSEMKSLLKSEHDQLQGLQQQALHADSPAPATAVQPAIAAPAIAAPGRPKTARTSQAADNTPWAQSKSAYAAAAAAGAVVPVMTGIGMLTAALAGLYFWFRRRAAALNGAGSAADSAAGEPAAGDPAAADGVAYGIEQALSDLIQEEPQAPAHARMREPDHEAARERVHEPTQDPAAAQATQLEPLADDSTQPLLPIMTSIAAAGRSEINANMAQRAPVPEVTVNMRVDGIRLDYNLMDLDQTSQHVQMPSVLNQHAVVRERRTNLADVLKMAIEREPDRHDLRMKLLELYYSAAATNRQAFLEVVQNLAGERHHLTPEQWDKVAYMGRQIASENPMFVEESPAEDDLAECA
jgi:pilus assembly protein FimV